MIVSVCEPSFEKKPYILRTVGLSKDKVKKYHHVVWAGGIDLYFDREEEWLKALEEFKDYVYATQKVEMEQVVGQLLREKNLKLAVAESCTAGLLSARLVNVPGSSSYFLGGFITYANELKTKLLSVEESLIEKYGAVSEEVCRAMCIGVLEETDADVAVAITGVAGPSGSEKKPPGSLFVGVCTDKDVVVKYFRTEGDRNYNRFLFTQLALDELRKFVMERYP
ncbi:CinA domain protein [Thermocrinis albus DSM 14484]|uniref:CinA domain protein n=1 Tax=Thermocrinis albus (strain DSM 14484 / JCM 11386 / HI 11/12) TaxID=638303 RepID=D3SNM2_THEAH|nr:CinA family protein [Thermocrinis albus]ADC88759.1 CinA domain protein [Thermocrinis albus DSM 14484]